MPSLHRHASSRHSGKVLSSTSPLACLPTHGGPSTSPVASSCQAVQAGASAAHADLACPPECCLRTPVIAPSAQHCVVLFTLQTFEPYTPRQARQSRPIPLSLIFCAYPARTASRPCPCLTPLLRCASTRALPHPRALRHVSSKSRRVRGEPRRSFRILQSL